MKIKRIISFFVIMLISFVAINSIKVNANDVTTSSDLTIEGAQIRTVGNQGLRFVANKNTYTGTNVTAWGILLAYGEAEASETFVKDGVVNGKIVVCAEMTTLNEDGKFAATLINIPENAYTQKVTARAYVVDDENYVYSASVETRSIYQVAQLVKEAVGYESNSYIENVITISEAYIEAAPVRIAADGNPSLEGNYMLFGSYPQTKVDETTLINTLNNKVRNNHPMGDDNQGWTSYEYHIDGRNDINFMWYIDVEEDGQMYRGVYFNFFRPFTNMISSSEANSYQDDNGYTTHNIYWFKFEPIKWKILVSSNGKITLFSELILDSQEYTYYDYSTGVEENNYEHSTLRTWLNNDFYNGAFNSNQKLHIQTTLVDNSASTVFANDTTYTSNNTNDKVWLLSYQDATNINYDFINDERTDTIRQKQATDYAKCMGVRVGEDNCVYWWLRSPFYEYSNKVSNVDASGIVKTLECYYTYSGIAPAIKIR